MRLTGSPAWTLPTGSSHLRSSAAIRFSTVLCGPRDVSAPSISACFSAIVSLAALSRGRRRLGMSLGAAALRKIQMAAAAIHVALDKPAHRSNVGIQRPLRRSLVSGRRPRRRAADHDRKSPTLSKAPSNRPIQAGRRPCPAPACLCDHQTLGIHEAERQIHAAIGLGLPDRNQALVRLPMDQMRRDRLAGLNTATFISGYEGSPLGGYDLALRARRTLLDEHRIHFVPASMRTWRQPPSWAARSITSLGESKYDGVVGIWYGKGPGRRPLRRHLPPRQHGRHRAATAPRWSSAATTTSAKSSTIPHQSDFSFYNFGMPLFYPGNMQEILDYGLLAIALSRYSRRLGGHEDGDQHLRRRRHRERRSGRACEIRIPEGYEKRSDARLVVAVHAGAGSMR